MVTTNGQQAYDFDEEVMFFMSPGQVFGVDAESNPTGWILLIHPDFIWNTPLGKNIRNYEYFDYSVYSVNETLFLSDKKEALINNIIQNIQQEYLSNIDKFSQNIIISQLETLLNYGDRFLPTAVHYTENSKSSHT